jgi:hypothetical protein
LSIQKLQQLTSSSISIVDGKVSRRRAGRRRRQAGTRPRHGGSGRAHSNETAVAIGTRSRACEHRRVADRHSGALRIFKNAERQTSGETFDSIHARVRRRAVPKVQQRCNLRTHKVILNKIHEIVFKNEK